MDLPNGVAAPIVVAVALMLIGGVVTWARSTNRAVRQVARLAESLTELATQVRDLAATATDVAILRAELASHRTLTDDRWRMLGGFVPHPRYGSADDRPKVARP